MSSTGTIHQQTIPITAPNGAVVGEIRPTRYGPTLHKMVNPARHMLRRPPGWALSAAHVETLRAAGGERIILEGPDGTTWSTTIANFDRHGRAMERGGFELQVSLPLKWWRETRPGARQLSMLEGVA